MLPFLTFKPEPTDTLGMAIADALEKVSTMSGSEMIDSLIRIILKWGLKVIAAMLIYIVGRWLIKRIRKILISIFKRREMEASFATFALSFVNITLTVVLFVIIVGILGVPTSTFAALLAAGGLAVGMALSGTLQNFAGGVMILLFKPFKVGDFINVNGLSGTVDAITITTTQIHTPDNKIIHLPNGPIANNNIENYSMAPHRRIEWLVSISYGDDADNAIKTMTSLLKEDQRVLSVPEEPYAVVSELGDSAVIISARAWVSTPDYWSVLWDMNKVFYNELPKNGIRFPFPQLDVHIDGTIAK